MTSFLKWLFIFFTTSSQWSSPPSLLQKLREGTSLNELPFSTVEGLYWDMFFINKKVPELPAGFKLWAAADRPKVWGIKLLSKQRTPGNCCCQYFWAETHWRLAAFVITTYRLSDQKRKASEGPSQPYPHPQVSPLIGVWATIMECLLIPANCTLRTIGIFSRTKFPVQLYQYVTTAPSLRKQNILQLPTTEGCLIFTQLLSALREQEHTEPISIFFCYSEH